FPEKYRQIIRRLQKAQSENELRKQMTLEDDIQEQLDNIWRKAAEDAEKIAAQEQALLESKQIIADTEKALLKKDKAIEEGKKALLDKEKALQDKDDFIRKLQEELEKQGKK
ncbi:MAG: hypothetical protein EAZ97_16195, partial [Bacteroidetes bacterium]